MSIDLRERKKLKKRTISLMDDWVFKAVIGDPEDEVCLSSFFQAIDPDFRKVRLLPGEKKWVILTTKQFVMISAV